MAEKKNQQNCPRTATPTEATKHLQNRILDMYRDNPNFNAIARELNFSETYIKKMYRVALKAIIVDNVDNHRKLQLARLDKLHVEAMAILTAFHPVIAQGNIMRDIETDENGHPIMVGEDGTEVPKLVKLRDSGPVLSAIDRILRIEDRRAKLLGLDMPTKTALTNPDGTKEAQAVQFYIPDNKRDSD